MLTYNQCMMNPQKNIRRRVYDALNVLKALNIIEHQKKDIFWKGMRVRAPCICAPSAPCANSPTLAHRPTRQYIGELREMREMRERARLGLVCRTRRQHR
jgi:hypothetical protein